MPSSCPSASPSAVAAICAVPSPPQSAHNCRVNWVSCNPKRFAPLKRCVTSRAQSGPTRPDLCWRPTPLVVQGGWAVETSAADAAPARVSVSLAESAYYGGEDTELVAGRFRHVGICKKDLRGNGCGTLEILIFIGTSKMKSLQAFV